jgi:glycosyltransferase involved in cell wall biosynthesis
MKKVLVYKSELLPYSETFIKEQTLSLKRWKPVLVGLRRVAGLDLDELDVRVLNGEKNTWRRVYQSALRQLGKPDPAITAKLETENASLIHIHFGVDAVNFWPVAQALGLPILVTLHGYDINIFSEWWRSGNGGRTNKAYPDRLLALARQPRVRFVAVSEAIRRRAIDYGIPAERLSVRYIGVDTRKFQPGGKPLAMRPRRVLYVGRMVEKKGVAFLIEAFAKVCRDIPDAELVMIGDGPLLQHHQKLSRRLGVSVRFLGACDPAEVRSNMNQARVFCLPSVTAQNGDAEGFGIVILEAQASGVPVITSALGGATEGIEEGKTGLSFPERDINGLAAHIRTLLLDDELAMAMSAAAPRFVREKFDIQACTRSLEDCYDDMVEEAKYYNSNSPTAKRSQP